ncbi:MAG: hypothetical protein M1819_003771 [Sarea resinae]|nr:MAG: hypothetical protein M1819_003771 [Sarea resinae]
MNPNDATIDIPLTNVTSRGTTGARKADRSPSPSGYVSQPDFQAASGSEKSGLFQRPGTGGRRKINKLNSKGEPTGRVGTDGVEESLTQMGKIYTKVLNFSVFARYIVYILPLAIAIAIPIIVGATVAEHADIGGVRIVWVFTWIEIVWLSLWGSKVVSRLLPTLFQFLCGIVSSGTRKYALLIKSLEIPLSLCGWALVSLATFIPMMTRNPDTRAAAAKDSKAGGIKEWESVVQKILAAAMVASLVFLAEKFFIQILSINYHRRQFNGRIHESKHKIWLLSLLYDASRQLFPAYCHEFADEDYLIHDAIELPSSRRGLHHRSGSSNPMRIIQNVGRVGDKITSAFGNVAHEITGKEVFNPNSAHSVVVEALEKKRPSEALAKRLWMSFVVEGKDALYLDDIVEVLGSDRQEEAEECFFSLDQDGNGDVSLDEMIMTIAEIGRERKSIANSMHDVDQAIHVLDRMLCTVVFVIVVFIFIAFLNKSFTTTLATAGTAFLSMSFVFSVSAQEILGSCIFLFVKHPYDIGDRVDIGQDQLTVEHISLLYTVFKRVSNHRMVQIPNIVMNTLWVENISRSRAMREQLSIFVSIDTTLEDIQALRDEMQAFVTDKDNSRDFQPEIDVEVLGISEMDKMELRVEIRHKSNWANETVRAARRSKFMCALVLALRRIPVFGPSGGGAALGDPANPSYSVTVSDAEAAAKRAEYAETQDAARLHAPSAPKGKVSDAMSGSQSDGLSKIKSAGSGDPRITIDGPSEHAIVNSLNARTPLIDHARDDYDVYHRDDLSLSRVSTERGRASSDTHRIHGNVKDSLDVDTDASNMLRRASTKGRRKPNMAPAAAPSATSVLGASTALPEAGQAGLGQQQQQQTASNYLQPINEPPFLPAHGYEEYSLEPSQPNIDSSGREEAHSPFADPYSSSSPPDRDHAYEMSEYDDLGHGHGNGTGGRTAQYQIAQQQQQQQQQPNRNQYDRSLSPPAGNAFAQAQAQQRQQQGPQGPSQPRQLLNQQGSQPQ